MIPIDDMQVRHALANVVQGSKLEQVLARWSGYRPTVKVGNTYLIQGYIDILRSIHEIAAAIDETIDPRLPAHCFDPKEVALFFNVPEEELVWGSSEDTRTTDGGELLRIAEAIEKIAEHIVPEPQAIVGTDYIAERLGCTQTWITDQTRRGEIPRSCCVEGTGNGKPWKYHRKKIDSWIRSR
jgi:hypothetical protein